MIVVKDPFMPDPEISIAKGPDAWVLRDIQDASVTLGHVMVMGEAMRTQIPDGFVFSRSDRLLSDIVTGVARDDRGLTEPTVVDLTPALECLSMQDFVDLQGEEFQTCAVTDKILEALHDMGDPRASRVMLYVTEWSTPDANGDRAAANLSVDQAQLLSWLELNRPEISDELKFRSRAYAPSYCD